MIYADKPDDKKIKKKLWMKIAKYLFDTSGVRQGPRLNIQEAMEMILEKSRILKIDDLLPLFPPDGKVQEMKEHLCKCLDEYHKSIESLKKELEDNSHNAELLRKQSRKYKHKHININPSQMCDICYKPIFDREFYVFPCQHAYHRVCL